MKEFIHSKTGESRSTIENCRDLEYLCRLKNTLLADINKLKSKFRFKESDIENTNDLDTAHKKAYFAYRNINTLLRVVELKIDTFPKELMASYPLSGTRTLSRGIEYCQKYKEWIRVEVLSFAENGQPLLYKIVYAGKVFDKSKNQFRMKWLCNENDIKFESIHSAIRYYETFKHQDQAQDH